MLSPAAPATARRTRRQPALLLVLVGLLLGACTGAAPSPSGVASLEDPNASASPGASDGPAASLTPEDAMLAFARCMREHGVDMPDPQPGGQGGVVFNVDRNDLDPETFEAAQEACGEIMQDAGFGPGRSMSPEDQDALVAFASCMREHGIDMPDPQTSGGAGIRIGGDGIDPDDPDFQDAMEACQSKLPGGGPNGRDGDGPEVGQSGG